MAIAVKSAGAPLPAAIPLLLLLLLLQWPPSYSLPGRAGSWELLLNSSGVVAMHVALTHLNTVIIFDQTSSGPSGYPLPCAAIPTADSASGESCSWAHSMEYDVAANTIRPLTLKSDTWCSSGSFLSDGTLQQAGGYAAGIRKIRHFRPCSDRSCDWNESSTTLAQGRWYSTNQIIPDSAGERVFIVGGLNATTYEFIPKSFSGEHAYDLPFLRQTGDSHVRGNNNLYPFVHLSSDGNLFIFANRDSILFDYRRRLVLRNFPRIPGEGARNYPGTGSSVMLPLDYANGFRSVEIMVCGGAADGAYQAALRGEFYPALSSCGRMAITDENPRWEMEEMPGPRLMSDMLILPTGNVLLINGATHGVAGWGRSTNPALAPYLYYPDGSYGERFSILRPSKIARMYHSAASLLADGRVFVGGSNPYFRYNFSGYPYPTELRLEAFTPYYMWEQFDRKRPANVSVRSSSGDALIKYGEEFFVWFQLNRKPSSTVEVVAYAPPFVTHSLAMNQRLLRLERLRLERRPEKGLVRVSVRAPPSPVAAPSGYYLLTVINGGIPSKSQWARFVGR